MKRLTFLISFLLAGFAVADQTMNRPVTFASGSSLTIQSGVTVDFAAGSVVDFTGATVTGLTVGGGSGNITAVENPVAGNIGVWRSGTTLGVGSATEVLTYSDSGDSFIPYFNTAPTTHVFDRLLFGASFTIAGTSPNQILNVGWLGLDKTGSDLADVVTRNFADLQNKPTTLAGYGITDGGGTAAWGGITGTLSAQTDLQSALTARQTTAGALALAGFSSITGTVPFANLPTGTGSSNVVAGGVITAGGPTGSSSLIPVITYNAAGQLTAVTTAAISGYTAPTGTGFAHITSGAQDAAATLDGSTLTTLNATNLSSGTVNQARLGSGGGGSTKFLREDSTWQTVAGGGGDASTNTATSVDGEVVLFSSTTGKLLKRSTGTGIAVLTSGVQSTVTAPSGAVVGTTDTQTLSNKRTTKRVTTAADATSITPASDTSDLVTQTNTQAAGTFTVNAPTGTPTDGQGIAFRIKSTNAQTYAWNAIYRGGANLPLPTVSTAGKTDYVTFYYNSVDTKWDLAGTSPGY